jgi:hypothetical protein
MRWPRPRGLDLEVHARHRREQRIDRDHADRAVGLRVLVGRDVAAAAVDLDLHAQVAVPVQRGDVQVRVQHLDVGVHLEVAGAHLALAPHLERGLLGAVALELEAHLLQVEDDLGHVLDHAGQGRELVEHAVDSHRGDRRALQRREQRAAQRIPSVIPNPRSSGSIVNLPYRSVLAASGAICFGMVRFFHFIVQPPRGWREFTSSRARRSVVR